MRLWSVWPIRWCTAMVATKWSLVPILLKFVLRGLCWFYRHSLLLLECGIPFPSWDVCSSSWIDFPWLTLIMSPSPSGRYIVLHIRRCFFTELVSFHSKGCGFSSFVTLGQRSLSPATLLKLSWHEINHWKYIVDDHREMYFFHNSKMKKL